MTTLEKVRKEIESEYNKFRNRSEVWDERANGIGTALDIIDRYAEEQAEIQADYDRQKASGMTDGEWEYGKGGE